ncbi:MAG: DNA polymerase V, partial [Pseudohongiellaceae bacterium]
FLSKRQYSKAGIGLIELVEKYDGQQDLFCRGQPLISDKVMSTLDLINKKYGRGTAFIAAQGIRKPWVMRQNFKSPAYTTQWADLPIVRG